MALKIRLSRAGGKKRPFYRIVVAEAHSARDNNFVERLGTFNPLLPKDHAERLKFDLERAKYWLSVGAQPTDRVAGFLGAAKVIPMPERGNNPQKAQPKAKAVERQKAKEEKAQAKLAADAAAQNAPAADNAPAAVVEAPAVETPATDAPAA